MNLILKLVVWFRRRQYTTDQLNPHSDNYVGHIIARQLRVKCICSKQHKPLLELGGKQILGLKRCANCGLSETYWERFPFCEYIDIMCPWHGR